jgi:hypothetical protein
MIAECRALIQARASAGSNSQYERHAIIWPLQIAITIEIGIASLPNLQP